MTDAEKRPKRPYAPLVVALWRNLWGWCPECNSDAPYKDVCEVCKGQDRESPQSKWWWERYLYFRDNASCDD